MIARSRRAHAALAVGAALTLALVALSEAAINVRLVSRTSGGTPADGNSATSEAGALSHDGKLVAFRSEADNLPGGDGFTEQVYARNMSTGKTRLVSKDNNGDPAGADVYTGGISASGRFVTFHGLGIGLPGANGQNQVWVHDRETNRTRLASRDNDGDPGDHGSGASSLSADGRRVVFDSSSDNLPGGTGTASFVYLRNLDANRTSLVSRTNDGAPATGYLYGQAVSSDGRRVAFYSADADLPGGSEDHVYVRDLDRDKTILIDRTSNGTIANGRSYNASISGNGRFVAFESQATNLPGGGASSNQVYLRDIKLGRTRLVGRNNAGEPQTGYAEFTHPSGNGRYVQFVAAADNLPGGDGVIALVYTRDMREGKTRLVSRADNGDPPDAEAQTGSISLDGRWAAFESPANNLGGDPGYRNIFRAGPIG